MVDRAISALRTCLSHGSLHGGPRYISSQNLLVSRKSPWWTELYQLSGPACLTEVSMVDRAISALRTCLSHGSHHGGPSYISSQDLLVSRKSPWWTELYQLSGPACLTEVSTVDRGISALRTCLSHGSLHGGPRYISSQNLLVSRKSPWWTEVYQLSEPACLTEVSMVDRGISALRTCLSHGSLHGGPRYISSQNLLVSRKSPWWTEVYQLSEPACLTEVSMVDRGISALRTCLSHGSLHGVPRYISSQNLLVSRKSTWWTELYQLSEPACLTEVYMVDRAISALRTCLSHGSLHGGPRYISSQNLLVSRKSPWWTEVYQLSEPACLTEVSMVDRGISALRTCLSHGSLHGGPRYISSQNLLVSRKFPWWTEVYQLSEPACLTEVSMVDRGISALRTCLSHGSLHGGPRYISAQNLLVSRKSPWWTRYISSQNLLVSRKSTWWTEVYQRSEPACLTEVYIVDRGISALRTCLSHGSLHRGPRYISAQNLLVSRKSTSWTEVYQRSEPACLTEVYIVDRGISALRTCLSHGSLHGGQGISALRTCLSHGSFHDGPSYISAQNLLVSRKSPWWTRYISSQDLLVSRKSPWWTEGIRI